jgi:hypothetical protein
MAKKKPSHADAELILKLYELRREPVMRESRRTIASWQPKTFEDVRAIIRLEDPRNAAWRQVSSYFEMAYGFARHGVVPADFLAENTGEGLMLFAKMEPHLKAFRKEVSPTAFRNAEWLVRKSAVARERMKLHRKRIAATLAAGRKTEPEAVREPVRSKAPLESEQHLPLAFAEVGERGT